MTYSTDRDSLISPGNLDTLAEYARSTPPGAFVEVGVYRGGSARVLYRVAEEQNRKLFLCDTFAGHPEPSDYDDPAHPARRYADCADPAALQQEMPNASVIVGDFPAGRPLMTLVAFAHVDVDLYESTRDAIRVIAPMMARGGIMYFDDYGLVQGATKAIDELLPSRTVLSNGKALVRF